GALLEDDIAWLRAGAAAPRDDLHAPAGAHAGVRPLRFSPASRFEVHAVARDELDLAVALLHRVGLDDPRLVDGAPVDPHAAAVGDEVAKVHGLAGRGFHLDEKPLAVAAGRAVRRGDRR